MIVERFTWKAKVGCRAEVIELVKALVEEIGLTPRVCSYVFGPYDIVSSDLEFETMEDREKFWADFDGSGPAWAEFHEKLPDLTGSGATHELLQVH
jgi:hypothetical protein